LSSTSFAEARWQLLPTVVMRIVAEKTKAKDFMIEENLNETELLFELCVMDGSLDDGECCDGSICDVFGRL
jgi:hypothetical protein